MLLASDVLYSSVAQPEIKAVLADKGIEGDAVPDSQFLQDGIKWLDESAVDTALSGVSGSTGGTVDDGLIHGLGLVSASVDGVELTDGVPVTVDAGGTPQLDVEVQNQGEAEETGVTVTVTIDGGDTLEQEIGSIAPAETETVTIPLTPAPRARSPSRSRCSRCRASRSPTTTSPPTPSPSSSSRGSAGRPH